MKLCRKDCWNVPSTKTNKKMFTDTQFILSYLPIIVWHPNLSIIVWHSEKCRNTQTQLEYVCSCLYFTIQVTSHLPYIPTHTITTSHVWYHYKGCTSSQNDFHTRACNQVFSDKEHLTKWKWSNTHTKRLSSKKKTRVWSYQNWSKCDALHKKKYISAIIFSSQPSCKTR